MSEAAVFLCRKTRCAEKTAGKLRRWPCQLMQIHHAVRAGRHSGHFFVTTKTHPWVPTSCADGITMTSGQKPRRIAHKSPQSALWPRVHTAKARDSGTFSDAKVPEGYLNTCVLTFSLFWM